MNTLGKIAIGVLVGGGAYAGYKYFSGLKQTSTELESVSSLMIHKMGLDGLTIRVDITLKNPTSGTLSIKYPFVKLLHENAMIGSSKVIDKDIQLSPFGETHIEQILINVPIMSILNLAKSLVAKQPVKVVSKIISTINLGWKKLPFEKSQEHTLKN